MDENNQYGIAVTKPLPYGCIKKRDRPPTLAEFNKILDKFRTETLLVTFSSSTLNLTRLSLKLCYLMNSTRQYLKKIKKLEPYERSTLPLLSVMIRKEGKDKINSFPYNSKTHSTLKEKKYVALYAKDLHFLITRAGWLVLLTFHLFTVRIQKRFRSHEPKSQADSNFICRKRFL